MNIRWHFKSLTDCFLSYKLLDILFGHCTYVLTAHRLQYYQYFLDPFLHSIFSSIASLSVWGRNYQDWLQRKCCSDNGGRFLPHIPGHGLFLRPFKKIWLIFCQLYWALDLCGDIRKPLLIFLTGPIQIIICFFLKLFWTEYIEAFICCKEFIIDEVMGVSSFVWSGENLDSPDFFIWYSLELWQGLHNIQTTHLYIADHLPHRMDS